MVRFKKKKKKFCLKFYDLKVKNDYEKSGRYSWYQSPYPATPFHEHLHQPQVDPSKYYSVEILLVIVSVNF